MPSSTKFDYSENEIALARRCRLPEYALQLAPYELYVGMMERVFLDNQQGPHVAVLRRVVFGWRERLIVRGTPEFEALFEPRPEDSEKIFRLDSEQTAQLAKWNAAQDAKFSRAAH